MPKSGQGTGSKPAVTVFLLLYLHLWDECTVLWACEMALPVTLWLNSVSGTLAYNAQMHHDGNMTEQKTAKFPSLQPILFTGFLIKEYPALCCNFFTCILSCEPGTLVTVTY